MGHESTSFKRNIAHKSHRVTQLNPIRTGGGGHPPLVFGQTTKRQNSFFLNFVTFLKIYSWWKHIGDETKMREIHLRLYLLPWKPHFQRMLQRKFAKNKIKSRYFLQNVLALNLKFKIWNQHLKIDPQYQISAKSDHHSDQNRKWSNSKLIGNKIWICRHIEAITSMSGSILLSMADTVCQIQYHRFKKGINPGVKNTLPQTCTRVTKDPGSLIRVKLGSRCAIRLIRFSLTLLILISSLWISDNAKAWIQNKRTDKGPMKLI